MLFFMYDGAFFEEVFPSPFKQNQAMQMDSFTLTKRLWKGVRDIINLRTWKAVSPEKYYNPGVFCLNFVSKERYRRPPAILYLHAYFDEETIW